MDRLPTHNELKFQRLRKALFLKLTTVIISLSVRFEGYGYEAAAVRERASMVYDDICRPFNGRFTDFQELFSCIMAEIDEVHWLFKQFLFTESGDRRRTKKLEAGIKRLEFLRDNWDDLEIVGDLRYGYELRLKK